jgi:hypothetical protein
MWFSLHDYVHITTYMSMPDKFIIFYIGFVCLSVDSQQTGRNSHDSVVCPFVYSMYALLHSVLVRAFYF